MGEGELCLRPAERCDLPTLLQLEQICFDSERLSRRSFRNWLQAPHARLWVAERNRLLCGYALLWCYHGGRVARLYSLGVHPECRGRGVGRQLYRALEYEARILGYEVMHLEVAERNAGARRLYQQLGFTEFARIVSYYADGSTALRLEKSIDYIVEGKENG